MRARLVKLSPSGAKQLFLEVLLGVEGGVEAEAKLVEVLSQPLLHFGLFFQVERCEHFEVDGDENGGGLCVFPEVFELGESFVPVVDLFVQVFLNELCVLQFAIVDVCQFLQSYQLIANGRVVLLDCSRFLLLHIKLGLLARQLLL